MNSELVAQRQVVHLTKSGASLMPGLVQSHGRRQNKSAPSQQNQPFRQNLPKPNTLHPNDPNIQQPPLQPDQDGFKMQENAGLSQEQENYIGSNFLQQKPNNVAQGIQMNSMEQGFRQSKAIQNLAGLIPQQNHFQNAGVSTQPNHKRQIPKPKYLDDSAFQNSLILPTTDPNLKFNNKQGDPADHNIECNEILIQNQPVDGQKHEQLQKAFQPNFMKYHDDPKVAESIVDHQQRQHISETPTVGFTPLTDHRNQFKNQTSQHTGYNYKVQSAQYSNQNLGNQLSEALSLKQKIAAGLSSKEAANQHTRKSKRAPIKNGYYKHSDSQIAALFTTEAKFSKNSASARQNPKSSVLELAQGDRIPVPDDKGRYREMINSENQPLPQQTQSQQKLIKYRSAQQAQNQLTIQRSAGPNDSFLKESVPAVSKPQLKMSRTSLPPIKSPGKQFDSGVLRRGKGMHDLFPVKANTTTAKSSVQPLSSSNKPLQNANHQSDLNRMGSKLSGSGPLQPKHLTQIPQKSKVPLSGSFENVLKGLGEFGENQQRAQYQQNQQYLFQQYLLSQQSGSQQNTDPTSMVDPFHSQRGSHGPTLKHSIPKVYSVHRNKDRVDRLLTVAREAEVAHLYTSGQMQGTDSLAQKIQSEQARKRQVMKQVRKSRQIQGQSFAPWEEENTSHAEQRMIQTHFMQPQHQQQQHFNYSPHRSEVSAGANGPLKPLHRTQEPMIGKVDESLIRYIQEETTPSKPMRKTLQPKARKKRIPNQKYNFNVTGEKISDASNLGGSAGAAGFFSGNAQIGQTIQPTKAQQKPFVRGQKKTDFGSTTQNNESDLMQSLEAEAEFDSNGVAENSGGTQGGGPQSICSLENKQASSAIGHPKTLPPRLLQDQQMVAISSSEKVARRNLGAVIPSQSKQQVFGTQTGGSFGFKSGDSAQKIHSSQENSNIQKEDSLPKPTSEVYSSLLPINRSRDQELIIDENPSQSHLLDVPGTAHSTEKKNYIIKAMHNERDALIKQIDDHRQQQLQTQQSINFQSPQKKAGPIQAIHTEDTAEMQANQERDPDTLNPQEIIIDNSPEVREVPTTYAPANTREKELTSQGKLVKIQKNLQASPLLVGIDQKKANQGISGTQNPKFNINLLNVQEEEEEETLLKKAVEKDSGLKDQEFQKEDIDLRNMMSPASKPPLGKSPSKITIPRKRLNSALDSNKLSPANSNPRTPLKIRKKSFEIPQSPNNIGSSKKKSNESEGDVQQNEIGSQRKLQSSQILNQSQQNFSSAKDNQNEFQKVRATSSYSRVSCEINFSDLNQARQQKRLLTVRAHNESNNSCASLSPNSGRLIKHGHQYQNHHKSQFEEQTKKKNTVDSSAEMIKTEMTPSDSRVNLAELSEHNNTGSSQLNRKEFDQCSDGKPLNCTPNIQIDQDWQKELKTIQRGQKLGGGSFGVVYQGLYNGQGNLPTHLAIKVVRAEDPGLLSKLKHECELLRGFEHPNIVKYYGCVINEEIQANEASIFLELMPHSLQTQYRNFGPLHERVIRRHTIQILRALDYLHNHEPRIIHGDLKAANILSDGSQIKLTDFGDSRVMKALPTQNLLHSSSQSGAIFTEIKGSILWMAPEILFKAPVGRRSDIWSLGCTLIELASAKHPWTDISDLLQLLTRLENREIPEIPGHLSESAQNFIKRCLKFEKAERPSAADLLLDPFVSDPKQPVVQPQSPHPKEGQ